MDTNLALDQELLDRALQEFIARREQRRVAELFGKLEWDARNDRPVVVHGTTHKQVRRIGKTKPKP